MYGVDAFEYSVLEIVKDKTDLIKREQYWIEITNVVNTGYNIRSIADSNIGFKHSEETKSKLSISHKGKKLTQDHKDKIGKALAGRQMPPRTEEHKEKLRQSHLGKRHTEETKEKLRQARKNRSPQLT